MAIVIGSPQINLGGTFDSSFIKKATTSINKFAKDIKNVADKVNSQNLKISSGYEKVGQVYLKSSSDIVKSINQTKQVSAEMAKSMESDNRKLVDQVNDIWGAVEKNMAKSAQSQKDFQKSAKSFSSALWLMTQGIQQFGRAMTISFTVPIMAAAGLATKTFMEWEKGTLSIQRAAGITRDSANRITQSFVDISTQVPLTVEDLLKVGDAAAKAGIESEEGIVKFSKAVAMLSKLGGTAFEELPVGKLAEDLAMITEAFGENVKDIDKTASMLLATADAVPGGLGHIIEALRRASPMAATLNLSLSDTTAIVGTLIAAAVPASRAGTQVNTMLSNMITNSDELGEALGYLRNNITDVGESLDMTDKEIKNIYERMDTDMIGVLDELIQRYTSVSSSTDKAKHAQGIFGDTALKAILPLIENYDTFKELQSITNKSFEDGAYLAAAFELEASSLAGTFTVFTNAIKALGGALGNDLAPYVNFFLKTFTEGIRKLIEGWRALNPGIKFAIFLMSSLLAVVGPLALLLNTLFLSPLSGIVTFITFLKKANATIGLTAILTKTGSVGVLSLGGAFASVVPAIVGFTKALGIMLLGLGKILIVVGLIAGAVYLLGRAFGIGFKFPKMPEIKLPKYGKITAPKIAGDTEDIEAATEADKKAAKKKEKSLARELRDKNKARKKELRIIDEGIDAYEKVRDAEIKGRQKLVDEQQDALYQRRELWEDELRIEQEKIRGQQESLEVVEKTLKAAKKTLTALKKAHDAEEETAEGEVDIAEMSLDAAQERLKRLILLGKDEYNEEVQRVLEEIKHWEAIVLEKKQHLLAIQRANQEEEEAQEAIVDATQDQVDIQTDALDDLRDALAERKAIVDKEIDVLQDELKIRQNSLDSIKEFTQDKLDLLREEKDARQNAWDDEIAIIQDRLDAAKDFADGLADAGLSELPKATQAAIDEYDKFTKEFSKQIEGMQSKAGEALGFGFTKEKGWIAQWWEKQKEGFKELEEMAEEQGVSVSRMVWNGMVTFIDQISQKMAKFWIDGLFGEGTWEELRKEAGARGGSIIGFLLEGFLEDIRRVPGIIKAQIGEKVIAPIGELLTEAKNKGKEIIGNIAQGIWDGFIWVKDAVKSVVSWSLGGIGDLLRDAKQWGRSMIGNFAQGIWDGMDWVKDAIRNMTDWIRGILHFSEPDFGPLKEVNDWGKDMMKSYVGGIRNEIPNLESVLSGINVDRNVPNGNNLAMGESSAETTPAPAGPTIIKNYNIQPGQMIASRGEIRNFVRMLKDYEKVEEER